jgi:hypothetical protein
MVIDQKNGHYIFPEFLKMHDYWLILGNLRSGMRIFETASEVYDPDVDLRELFAGKEGYHKYILNSRVKRFPDTIRVRKDVVTYLIDLAAHAGTSIYTQWSETLAHDIRHIYHAFSTKVDLSDYQLLGRPPLKGFSFHALDEDMKKSGRFYDLADADKMPKRDPTLEGNLGELIARINSLQDFRVEQLDETRYGIFYTGNAGPESALVVTGDWPIGFKAVPFNEAALAHIERTDRGVEVRETSEAMYCKDLVEPLKDVLVTFGF